MSGERKLTLRLSRREAGVVLSWLEHALNGAEETPRQALVNRIVKRLIGVLDAKPAGHKGPSARGGDRG